MPIYEFVCSACQNEFEKIMSFSSTSLPACPNCGSAEVARQMGRPAIHFKGSGWYITDSKNSSKESSNGVSKKEESGGSGGAEVKTDAPAKETPAKSESAAPAAQAKSEG